GTYQLNVKTSKSCPPISCVGGSPKQCPYGYQKRNGCEISPPHSSSIDIHPNTKWMQNGVTVAGGHGKGRGLNQLGSPHGLYVDDDQTIYVADFFNNRIVEWKESAKYGRVVAGGNGAGNGTHQLDCPRDVLVDKETNSLI
ncbi:unnamed protein product, partial [Adineta steineri]